MLDGIDRISEKALAAHDGASVSVAVARDGEVVFADAWGFADVESRRLATPDTAYLSASVTKPVTATAVSLAADAGLLNLDDPVEEHLGVALPQRGFSAPTVRQTMQHRGGFGVHFDFAYDGKPASLADTVARYGGLFREPDTAFEYSNLGYGLLDAVLRNVTGRKPADFVREVVFEPLGVSTAQIGPSYVGIRAERYTADGRRYSDYDTTHRGASLLWASAPDLVRFGLGAPGLLAPGTAAAMFDPRPYNDDQGYGMGWFISTGEPRIVSHSGSMGGVATMLVVVPGSRLAVAVLTNRSGAKVRTAVLDHVLTELVPGFSRALLPPGESPEGPSPLTRGIWTGSIETYEKQLPITVTFGDGDVEVNVDGVAARTTAIASGGWDLLVTVPVRLAAPGVGPWSPDLMLALTATPEGELVGSATAMPEDDRAGWLGDGLSHHVKLARDTR